MLLSFPWAARQLVNLPVYSDATQLAVDLRDLRCFVGGRVFSDLGPLYPWSAPGELASLLLRFKFVALPNVTFAC